MNEFRYRVWDYPIRDRYTRIYKTIKDSGMLKSAEEGFKKVLASEQGEFAFIHDASQASFNFEIIVLFNTIV